MANASETVSEVCVEMNEDKGMRLFSIPFSVRTIWLSDLRGYAKRIFSAYEREMAAKDAEIARLKAALQPVMDVNLDGMDSYIRVNCESILKSIIIEAQRIYKEGCAE